MRRRSVDSKPVTIHLPNGDNYAATVVWDQDPPWTHINPDAAVPIPPKPWGNRMGRLTRPGNHTTEQMVESYVEAWCAHHEHPLP